MIGALVRPDFQDVRIVWLNRQIDTLDRCEEKSCNSDCKSERSE
jgi:hypothetical protein